MGAFMVLAKAVTRILAFLGKELVEVARRPGALASLVLGPFLIMAVFGLGYSGFKRPLNTIVVVPASTGLPTDPAYYENIAGAGIKVIQVAETDAGVDQQLEEGTVDLAVIAPPDTKEKLQAGQQSAQHRYGQSKDQNTAVQSHFACARQGRGQHSDRQVSSPTRYY